MKTLFVILHIIVSALLIIIVLAQEGKDPGMRGIQGSSSADMGDSFFKRAGGTTKEKIQVQLTTTVAILFLITTVVLVIVANA